MATKLEKLMFSISLLDRVSGPAGRIKKTLGGLVGSASAGFAKIAAGGAGVAAAGYTLNALAAPANEFNMAIGEVRSLDVAQGSLDALSDSAVAFSIKYGESATDFIKSSYDIQSAIAGLEGNDLAKFTNASNILAKGTKSDAATITNYMGTMYGIFKESADNMGKARWVEQLTGQTATAVKMFKTTGSEMAGAFTSLGAEARSAGIAQGEQIAVLGQLQATMSGSEAGTKYKAFLTGVAGAQDKLGLKFTDSAGRMLGMTTILDKIKGKFGETFTVTESDALKKAFGSDEAVGMIKLLMADTAGLKNNIQAIGEVKGMEQAQKMASSMVDPFERWSQGVQAIRIGFGQALLPVITPVVEEMAKGAGVIYNWTRAFPNLTRWIGYGVVVATGLTAAAAAFAAIGGVASLVTTGWSFSVGIASKVMTGFRWVLTAARTSMLFLNAAMWANPMGIVVGGVVLLTGVIGAAIYYWDDLKVKFKDVGWIQSIMGWLEKAAGGVKLFGLWLWDTALSIGKTVMKIAAWIFLFTNPIGWMIQGIRLLVVNWDRLKAGFMDSSWGQVITGVCSRIIGWFTRMWSWIQAGALAVGKFAVKLFLFTNPIALVAQGIRMLIGNRDRLKAAFMDSSWGQAILSWCGAAVDKFGQLGAWLSGIIPSYDGFKAAFMDPKWAEAIIGWVHKIIDKLTSLTGVWDAVKGKLSWLPGFGTESSTNDIPKTSPSLEAPRTATVPAGGASKSIANAITNNSTQTESRTVNVGKVVTSRPINAQEVGNQLWMGV